MSAPGAFGDLPGDPIADFRRAWKQLEELDTARDAAGDRIHLKAVAPLLEHVHYGGEEVRGYRPTCELRAIYGIPVVLDPDVAPGWLELRNGAGELVKRIRIA